MSSSAGDPTPAGYRLLRVLGRGGMGEVYLARDLTLDRDVAIKFVLPATHHGNGGARRRLLREAKAAAALDHPGICTVYEAGETSDGRAYIVMQYVDGEPLSAVLQRGPMPERDALELCAHIAEALHAAHQRGIVHRDLKPANVMVTSAGRPKILDLGIAKVVTAPSESVTASTETADGVVAGTPAYMSPEQIQQRAIDGRSDLFSLGGVLFECLTGRRAFDGATPLETMANVLHVDPPAPSTVRRELTTAHDVLCRRLLAKNPADRFQSADKVVDEIRQLVPDTSRTAADTAGRTGRPHRAVAAMTVAAILLAGAAGKWAWSRGGRLPEAPADARLWYDRGTAAIRQGAYFTGQRSLDEAVRLFPGYVLAHARLAEATAELDDEGAAKEHLLKVASLVPDESRLPEIERLRLQAVRALVLRDVDSAVSLYRAVAEKEQDPGSWLDLGRAQEAAGLRTDARGSYEQALQRDRQYAAGYLRLAFVASLEGRRDEALAAFGEAERLYRTAGDTEGNAEVLLRRGVMREGFGELKEARSDLDRALSLASSGEPGARVTSQQIRIRLGLAAVTISEGRFADAERIAADAIQQAETAEMETTAADALVDLAQSLMFVEEPERRREAADRVRRAIELADARGARRTGARARLQLASIRQLEERPAEALAIVKQVLPFLQSNRYWRMELTAQSIAARAHEAMGDFEQARRMSTEVLGVAERIKDESQTALAATNLASVTTSLGDYPAALRLRERAEPIHRRQQDKSSLPYDLANRADLLIRLGRGKDADAALSELEAGIAARLDAYVGRTRRAIFLRALAAAVELRCGDALSHLRRLARDAKARDSSAIMAPVLEVFCEAVERKPASRPLGRDDTDVVLARERQYWIAAAALRRGDPRAALAAAREGLRLLGTTPNAELRWRLAAAGAPAAAAIGDPGQAELEATARESIGALQSSWQGDFAAYAQRADLADLRKRSGILN